MNSTESSSNHSGTRLLVSIVLALWFVLVFALGAKGLFVQTGGKPPLPILLGATVPLLAFFVAYFEWAAFRAFVLASDLRLGAAIQAWRVVGLGFLALYVYGILPGEFALPAGLGDIAIGVTAPSIVIALIRRPGFANSPLFVTWNVLGILDLIVAVGTGAISSGFLPGFSGAVTTLPMSKLPLVLIPAYFVPIFVMLHVAALFQSRVDSRRL